MTDHQDDRYKEDQALSLLTNRLLLDFISLQVDAGLLPLDSAKKLLRFSSEEVKRGAPWLALQVDFFADVFERRFDETPYSDAVKR